MAMGSPGRSTIDPSHLPGGWDIPISSQSGNRKDEVRVLLGHVPEIRTACDIDLLVFLHRHPRMLLTRERMAEFVGYGIKKIAGSLENLIAGGVLLRQQKPSHKAQMYLLILSGPDGGWLAKIVKLASTREGRRDLLHALNSHAPSSAHRTLGRDNRSLSRS